MDKEIYLATRVSYFYSSRCEKSKHKQKQAKTKQNKTKKKTIRQQYAHNIYISSQWQSVWYCPLVSMVRSFDGVFSCVLRVWAWCHIAITIAWDQRNWSRVNHFIQLNTFTAALLYTTCILCARTHLCVTGVQPFWYFSISFELRFQDIRRYQHEWISSPVTQRKLLQRKWTVCGPTVPRVVFFCDGGSITHIFLSDYWRWEQVLH